MSPYRMWFAFLALVLLALAGIRHAAAQASLPPSEHAAGWRASPLTSDCTGPVDEAGRRWYEPHFDDSGWIPVQLPDAAIPAGQHRFYRQHFAFVMVEPQAALRIASSAGSLGYLNGAYLGRWGSDCDAPQAVAGAAEIDLTPFLANGNLLALQADAGPQGGRLDARVQTGAGKVWSVYRGNPVVDVGLSGNWDNRAVGQPAVLHEADGYRMWYSASGDKTQIGLALSPDGIMWHAVGDRPVLSPGASGHWDAAWVADPAVVKTDDGYQMVYVGSDGTQQRIGLATSPDGVTWVKHPAPVLKLGGADAFDSAAQSSPALHYDGRWLRMWYVGTDRNGHRHVGLALSGDGVRWFKSPANPVIDAATGSDESGIDEMTVVQANGGWQMWGSTRTRIFRFASPDGVAWTADPPSAVLGPGAVRSWTGYGVSSPSVLFDGASYLMWYAGTSVYSYGGGGARIGVASSADGIHWKERPSAVLEQRPGLGSYEEWTLGRACVLPEPGGYRMWYSGHYNGWRIQEANSTDGINWEREDNNVVLWPGPSAWDSVEVFNPRVVRVGEGAGALLHMWYSGWDQGPSYRIGHAVSVDDGKTWVKSSANPVLDVGPQGAWDSRSVQSASVVAEGERFRAWYMGQDGVRWQIGLATSLDGDYWTKYEGNPVMSPGPAGSWDGRHLYWLHVIKGGPGYQMWYSGTDSESGQGPIHLGYAESVDGIHWDRDAENPVSMPRPRGWWGQSYPAEPYVLREGNLYRMWYTERMDAQLYRLNYAWSAIPSQPPHSGRAYLPWILTLP